MTKSGKRKDSGIVVDHLTDHSQSSSEEFWNFKNKNGIGDEILVFETEDEVKEHMTTSRDEYRDTTAQGHDDHTIRR